MLPTLLGVTAGAGESLLTIDAGEPTEPGPDGGGVLEAPSGTDETGEGDCVVDATVAGLPKGITDT